MRLEPSEKDQRIKPFYIIAYGAFLLIPCFIFYKSLSTKDLIPMIGALLAILGFSFLLILSIRHNLKIKKRNE